MPDIVETRNFEWKIHNFTEDELKDMNVKKKLSTGVFEIVLDDNITKWQFKSTIHEGIFSFKLKKNESSIDDFMINFELFVRKSDGEAKFRHTFERDSDEFEDETAVCSLEVLKVDKIFESPEDFLVNKTLTLIAKLKLIQKVGYEDSDTSCVTDCRYLPIFEECFESKSYSDFKFVCSDGIEIKAHRFILAAFSPVMKAMLDTDMIESTTNVANVTDIDGETMTEILRYIYVHEVNDLENLAPKLLYGARKYDLDDLKDLCVESMIENLSTENAVEYFLLADQYDMKDLLECTAKFIKSNYKAVSDGPDWDNLTRKHLMQLLEFYQIPEHIQIFESTL